jgi:hypothetical protein
MAINEYISKLEQAYMARGYTKQQVDAIIVGFKLGVEFAGSVASGVISDLLVAPFANEDNILKEKK